MYSTEENPDLTKKSKSAFNFKKKPTMHTKKRLRAGTITKTETLLDVNVLIFLAKTTAGESP